jgi:uncharacterized protein (TIRG00374 family)
MRKHLLNLLKIAVTVVGLALVLSEVDLRQIGQTLLQANLFWVLIGFLLMTVSLVVRAYRWQLLLQGLGIRIPFPRLVELYFVGNFFNMALPSAFGGDVVRVVEAARDVRVSVATGTVILDRLTGLVTLFVMALVAFPFQPANFPAQIFWLNAIGALVGAIGIFILMEGSLIRRFGRWLPGPLSPLGDTPIARLLQAVQGCGWRAIGGSLLVSILFNLILVGWWLTCGLALGLRVPFSYYLLVMPALSLPLLIPSVSGLGPRELLAPTLFAVVGMPAGTAVSLSLLVFIITRLSGLLGVPIYIAALVRDSRMKEDEGRKTTSYQ